MVSEKTPILGDEKQPVCPSKLKSKGFSLEIKMRDCILYIVIYLVIGAFTYSYILQEEWTLIDSLYFTVVTFTTIGYGDLCPKYEVSKVFTCFYALFGITFIGFAMGNIANHIIEANEKAFETARSSKAKRFILSDTEDVTIDTNEITLFKQIRDYVLVFLPTLVLLYFGASVIGKGFEDWGFFETFYFLVVTSTTIGYGDYVPSGEYERLYCAFFSIIAVGTMGVMIGKVADLVMQQRRNKYYSYLKNRTLHFEDLIEMDTDGDQKVSLLEYVEFMLLAMEKVDKKLLEDIKKQFKVLDVSGTGQICKEDLRNSYTEKFKKVSKKIILAQKSGKLKQLLV